MGKSSASIYGEMFGLDYLRVDVVFAPWHPEQQIQGSFVVVFAPWHPEQQIQGSFVGFDWEEFRRGRWRQLCWDKVNLCANTGE